MKFKNKWSKETMNVSTLNITLAGITLFELRINTSLHSYKLTLLNFCISL